jgi:GDPmannose 4,6-dehydratase
MKTAIITGATGQDGAYLSKLLLDKGYKVVGTYRRSSSANFWRLEHLDVLNEPNFELCEFDITDPQRARAVINTVQPNEIYNLAAQSFVGTSFEQPYSTTQLTGVSVLNILEAIREVDSSIRFYQASTSEMFGKVQAIPQTEDTPFYPRSPYGVAKLYAHWMTINYREAYDIFATSGILFNHESPLRGNEFVTKKITRGVARILAGNSAPLELGNLDSKRDWGYAKDYVDGMWRMLQTEEPGTYVLATGHTHTVREFVTSAFAAVGIQLEFVDSGINERGIIQSIDLKTAHANDLKVGQELVSVNPSFFRPAEVELLIGDYTKAKTELNWEPKTSLDELVKMMVEFDLNDSTLQINE